jgi:predicted site-specific integrase-resolvase
MKYLTPAAKKYFAPRTVAQIIDVSRWTAMRLMKSGRLPAFEMLPGQWRCSEEALSRFLKKKEKESNEQNRPT